MTRRPGLGSSGRRLVAALLGAGLLVTLTACTSSTNQDTPDVPTVAPATASSAPVGPALDPAGTVVAAPAEARAMSLSGSMLALLSADGTEIRRYSTSSLADPPQISTTTELVTLTSDGDDGFVGIGPGRGVFVDPAGQVREVSVEVADPSAIAVGENEILVGTTGGHVLVFDRDFRLRRDIAGFVRVDAITVSPRGADVTEEQVVVLDRAQSSVTPIDVDTGDLGPALRAGNGATTATVDRYGRVLVANTRDDEILGFFGSPLVMRFRYPVPAGPFAVDYDDTRNVLWVSTTGNNEVVAYDLADGEPAERARFGSVAQPDRIAVDQRTGTVFVLSARGDGLQAVSGSVAPTGIPEPGP